MMNTETSLELNIVQDDTNILIPSYFSSSSRELEEAKNPNMFQETENDITINDKELRNINLENTQLTDSSCLQENDIVINDKELRNINLEDTKSTNSSCLQYDWSIAPKLLYVATEEYEPTNSSDLKIRGYSGENFPKGCQWSPDGTCLLVHSENFKMYIYELPREFYSSKVQPNFIPSNFAPALTLREGGPIYDTCWYPYMNAWDPSTCCFLCSSQDCPTHLWDAITGKLLSTYLAYNHVDEIEAAISFQFVNSGSEIWCGFKKAVRIFQTSRSGRQIKNIYFKHDFPNMRGLVSCIRENPTMSGLVAFGSYSNCIGLYKDEPICTFETSSGVTQVEFSSCGTKLYSAVRKNNEFLCWDLRNPGTVLYCLEGRQCDTNQRIKFSITPDNKHIISGGKDGNITVWELPDNIAADNNEHLDPKCKIKLSTDCINGISLHNNLPMLATSSGQRKCGTENLQRDDSVRLWWTS
ncbi:telomerase Cajal body protein 1 [Odontomachus brunneus]|uniref:telomerase Cajal body protein 1 n=1 Tax=Odontomachus brunneus TaxID=486640 RepID=UPI0013F27979|nr:telomerase Cajal body protein 1 [Odontomachus brunneus]XP_032674418.1 telomerase Cajal body protein 1 [Odontomachus brunneus]XP_032674419.1 telomerase Cajal body protein 1 [Odontomachus brunneus]XP_032674420.1 telomerase Cajal body protein 1 [Odontomachus brunneus]